MHNQNASIIQKYCGKAERQTGRKTDRKQESKQASSSAEMSPVNFHAAL